VESSSALFFGWSHFLARERVGYLAILQRP
jgi:hypothetical protein